MASSILAWANQVNNEGTQEPPAETSPTYSYYHAGPLFNIAELQNNIRLSSAIYKSSNGKYQPVLPQDLEQRDTTTHSIRDQDIKALLECDLALFTYDGSELDSGTVVEYMVAKFADIPAVIFRSDFRGSGDQGQTGDPWNLMTSFWPRTVGVVVNSMGEYKTCLAQALEDGTSRDISTINQLAGDKLVELTAKRIVEGFDEILSKPARMPKEMRENVYKWIALMPGFKYDDDVQSTTQMIQLLHDKEKKGLL